MDAIKEVTEEAEAKRTGRPIKDELGIRLHAPSGELGLNEISADEQIELPGALLRAPTWHGWREKMLRSSSSGQIVLRGAWEGICLPAWPV